jgi:peptidoglycan/LPS O-acetylase OafA/YrhL
VVILGLSWVIRYFEFYVLFRLYGTDPKYTMLVSLYFSGLGLSMAALSNHRFLRNKILADLGKLTMGIYVIHLVFVDLLRPIDALTNNWLWEIGYVLLVLSFSIISVKILSKYEITRKIVM